MKLAYEKTLAEAHGTTDEPELLETLTVETAADEMKSTREVDRRIRIGRPVAKELGSHPEQGQKLALLLLAKIFFPELRALRLESYRMLLLLEANRVLKPALTSYFFDASRAEE